MSTENTKPVSAEEDLFSSIRSAEKDAIKAYGAKGSHVGLDGVIANSQDADENATESQKKKQREKELEAALLHWSDEAHQHLQDMLDDIGNDIDAYKASREREAKMREARDTHDITMARHLLQGKHGDNVKDWKDDKVWTEIDNSIEEEQLTQETLAASIKQKFEDFEAETAKYGDNIPEDVKAELFEEMDELRAQAEKAGIEVDFDAAHQKVTDDSILEKNKIYKADSIVQEQQINETSMLCKEFKKAVSDNRIISTDKALENTTEEAPVIIKQEGPSLLAGI